MEKRALVLLFTLLMLCSAVAYADIIAAPTFYVKAEAVKDNILNTKTDHAEFNIIVENKGLQEETFSLQPLPDTRWSYQVFPDILAKKITVPAGSSGKILIYVKGSVPDNTYYVRVVVDRIMGETHIESQSGVMNIQVGDNKPVPPPEPDFDVDVSVPSQMDPTGTYNVVVNINNKNNRTLQEVNIKLASGIVNDETKVFIGPGEQKSVSFAVLLMDNIKPQQDQLQVTVDYEGKAFYDQTHNFEVVEYVPPFKTDIAVDKKFLREDRTITITNEGNVLKADTVRIETSLKERFFSWSKPKFKVLKDSGNYFFTWDVALEPQQSTQMKVTTSYRILLLFAAVILILLVYRIAMSNPLIVRKKFKFVHREHGGAISDIAVVIQLKNRGKETLSNLRVAEKVSKIVRLKKDSFEGSMHPVKMIDTHDGTLLEYRFGELTSGDERIIKYKVYSRLAVFGVFSIKPTVVEFTTKKGSKRKSKSSTILFGEGKPSKHEESKGHPRY
jgi:hypothetical protein